MPVLPINYTLISDSSGKVTSSTFLRDVQNAVADKKRRPPISTVKPLVIPYSANVEQQKALQALNKALDTYYEAVKQHIKYPASREYRERKEQAHVAANNAFFSALHTMEDGKGQAITFTKLLKKMHKDFFHTQQVNVRIVGISTLDYSKNPPMVDKADVARGLAEFDEYVKKGAYVVPLKCHGKYTFFPDNGIAKNLYDRQSGGKEYYTSLQQAIHNHFRQIENSANPLQAENLSHITMPSSLLQQQQHPLPAAAQSTPILPPTDPIVGVPHGTAQLPIEATINLQITGASQLQNIKITFQPTADNNGYIIPSDEEIINKLNTLSPSTQVTPKDITRAKALATADLIKQLGYDVKLAGDAKLWKDTIQEWVKTGQPTIEQITAIINKSENKDDLQKILTEAVALKRAAPPPAVVAPNAAQQLPAVPAVPAVPEVPEVPAAVPPTKGTRTAPR